MGVIHKLIWMDTAYGSELISFCQDRVLFHNGIGSFHWRWVSCKNCLKRKESSSESGENDVL